MKHRRLKAAGGILGESLFFETEISQHFQRRGMDRRGALILDRPGLGFQQQYRDALAQQRQRQDNADRSGPDHDHAIFALHIPFRNSCFADTSG
jgi:hypothetical protein